MESISTTIGELISSIYEATRQFYRDDSVALLATQAILRGMVVVTNADEMTEIGAEHLAA